MPGKEASKKKPGHCKLCGIQICDWCDDHERRVCTFCMEPEHRKLWAERVKMLHRTHGPYRKIYDFDLQI